jgi:hypothetical protein
MFDPAKAERAVTFINNLKHTKGVWHGVPFELLSYILSYCTRTPHFHGHF